MISVLDAITLSSYTFCTHPIPTMSEGESLTKEEESQDLPRETLVRKQKTQLRGLLHNVDKSILDFDLA